MRSFRKSEPPKEGQVSITGQNRYGPATASFGPEGRMLAYRLDTVTIQDLDRVRQDPVVKSSLRMLKLPILRSRFHIFCDDPKIAVFCETILEPHLRLLLHYLLTAFDFGIAIVEPIWKREPMLIVTPTRGSAPSTTRYRFENVWTIERLSHLDPGLNWPMVYPTGEFAGVYQLVGDTIIPEGRLLHWAVDAEFNEVYGNPATKAAIPFFELKQRALEDLSRYYSTYAVPTKKGFAPPGVTMVRDPETGVEMPIDNLTYLREQLDNLSNAYSIVMPSITDSNGQRLWEVEAFQVPPATNIEAYIQYLDEQIRSAMNVPALSQVQPVRGTYSLGQAQIDLFLQNEQAWIEQIESVLNDQLLTRIVEYNFGRTAPKARVKLMVDEGYLERILEAFVARLSMGEPVQTASGSMLVPDWEALAEELNVPLQIADTAQLMGGLGDPSPRGEFGELRSPFSAGTSPMRPNPFRRMEEDDDDETEDR